MTDETSTYFQRAQDEASPGGRYAAPPKAVTGASPLPLAAPNWATDPTGIEPPIDMTSRMPSELDFGFPHEARLHAQQVEASGAGEMDPSTASPAPAKLLRRL